MLETEESVKVWQVQNVFSDYVERALEGKTGGAYRGSRKSRKSRRGSRKSRKSRRGSRKSRKSRRGSRKTRKSNHRVKK